MPTRLYGVLLALSLLAGLPAYGQTSMGSSGLGWNRGGTVVTNDQNFVMIGNTPDATNERALTGSSTITITDNGPNGSVVLSVTGPLIQSSGGTGFGSYTAGDILVADNSGNLVKLALGANTSVLTVDTSLNPKVKWAAAGAGTVTSFSAGTLSPLFTTSVATATTTPALSFSLSNAAAKTWFGNATAGAAAPSYNATALPLDMGGTGTAAGSANAAFNALSPLTTAGDLLQFSGGVNARLAVGTANQVLGVTNAGTGLEYKTITAGTNISVSHGANSITINNTAGGTVTNFSAGDLSPLFTTTEATTTTTPALSFSLSNAAAYTVFGNNTSSSAAPAYQSMVTEQTPQAVAAVPGGASSVRSLPTSGTLTGDYFHYGNWASTNTITCNRCRITVIGTVNLSHDLTVNTELPGGQAGGTVAGSQGGNGAGIGAGPGGVSTSSNVIGGAGGGFGGLGGNAGTGAAGDRGARGGANYDINHQLFGSSGGGGVGNSASNANGAGGAGGGGFLLQATGAITINANITAAGANGTDTALASTGCGGGGSGGGVDIRSLSTVTVNVGKTISVVGGRGGNASAGTSGGGGGGAGGYIAIHGSTVTNNGTLTTTGGAAGTGSAGQAATAGASGTTDVASTVWYLRQY